MLDERLAKYRSMLDSAGDGQSGRVQGSQAGVGSGERTLMLSVLLDAIGYLRRPTTQGGAEAREWVARINDDSVFSFENICEVLGYNVPHTREALLTHGAKVRRPRRAPVVDGLNVRIRNARARRQSAA